MTPELHEIYSIDTKSSSSNSSNLQQSNQQHQAQKPIQSTTAVDIYSFGMVALEVVTKLSS